MKRSKLLQPNQTLYSFRHTGAIEIFKRTGSLTVLQQAMGHASLAVSLGYLRNLEVPMLKVEDMPMFEGLSKSRKLAKNLLKSLSSVQSFRKGDFK